MARITVEDCITRVPNRFELIMLAAQRARELSKGATPSIEVENDKNHVIALREIADGTIDPTTISQTLLDTMSGVDQDDNPLDEADDIQFEMEAPSTKFDFDQAIRDWERDGAEFDDDGASFSDKTSSDRVEADSGAIEEIFEDYPESPNDNGDGDARAE